MTAKYPILESKFESQKVLHFGENKKAKMLKNPYKTRGFERKQIQKYIYRTLELERTAFLFLNFNRNFWSNSYPRKNG